MAAFVRASIGLVMSRALSTAARDARGEVSKLTEGSLPSEQELDTQPSTDAGLRSPAHFPPIRIFSPAVMVSSRAVVVGQRPLA